MNDTNSGRFSAPESLSIEVSYHHGRGVVVITFDPIGDDDGNVYEWRPVSIDVQSGHGLSTTVLRDLPMASIAEQLLADRPTLAGRVEDMTPTGHPETADEKIRAAAEAWHEARERGLKVIPTVQRALGGLSAPRANHYIRLARAQGLIPEEGRRGPKPKGQR